MIDTHPKITYSIDQMIGDAMLKIQYYGEFCQFINFKKVNFISTCGVTINVHGMQYVYNSDFLDTLEQEEVNFIMIHEIFHLLWEHQARERRCGYDHDLSNVVQDMIINDVIKTDIIGRMEQENKKEHRNLSFAKMPARKKDNKTWVLTKPPEYKGALIYEDMYEWLYGEKQKYDTWKNNCKCDKDKKCQCNRADGEEPCECGDCPVSDYLRRIFDQLEMGLLDFLDKHLPSDVPEEYRKSIIENIKNNLRARGFETPEIETSLNKLTKSKKDYIKDIKIGINELFGTYKQKSITRRNRRSIPGVKGRRKDSYGLAVLCDTSGSMSGYLEKALSYVFQNQIIMYFVQCDAKVESFNVIKNKHELQKMKITGLGGTIITKGIQFIVNEKKLKKYNLLILSDGQTDVLDFKGFYNKCLILSVDKKCEVVNMNMNKIKQIIIKD